MNSNFLRVISRTYDKCKVCDSESKLFDVVDFHGNVDLDPERTDRKEIFPVSGIPIYFFKCLNCGLIYTRALDGFNAQDFKEYVYNSDWELHLLGDQSLRNQQVIAVLCKLFPGKQHVSGLDFGGGSGSLAGAIREKGYVFDNYDPHFGNARKPSGRFNLITCIEVFEHVSDTAALINDLDQMCSRNGGVFFSTVVSDHIDRCQGWGYCVPRSGHITFFTKRSLHKLFAAKKFTYTYLGTIEGLMWHYAGRGIIPYVDQNTSAFECHGG